MNAYELAEGILAIEERIFLTRQEHKLFQNSANMLRQQADRIAELEGEVSHLKHINKNWSISEGWALQRISELEKQVQSVTEQGENFWQQLCELKAEQEKQSKPVGVVIEIEEVYGHTFKKRKSKRVQWSKEVDVGTQLYTTPQTKPLSDDEIIKVRQMVRAKSTNNWADTFAFVRAIEERHGIK